MADSILLNKAADGVATLTLNRPQHLNAFDHSMIDQWYAALQEAFADPAVKVIVVTGAGRAFCAGGDIDDLAKLQTLDSTARKNYLWKHVHRIVMAMERTDKPVIAAVNGAARGAGMDMAVMCDIRIAAASASFAESYIRFGLIAGDAGTYFLPRLIGTARALELFWTGRSVLADEAVQIGLVNRVVPDTELMGAAMALARQIAAQSAPAVGMFKRAVYQGMNHSLVSHLDLISSHMAVLEDTPEHRERVSAFFDERAAKSAGKPS
jgi:enoyl-CoA hydratase/carnithine racemase